MIEWNQGLYKPDPVEEETTGQHPSDKIIRNPLIRAFSKLSDKQLAELRLVLDEAKVNLLRDSQKQEGQHTDFTSE